MAVDGPDLFGGLLPHEWLPNETLFSLCSRHHRLSGNRRSATTCRTLFGHPSQGSAHDFPSRLQEFERVTGARLGVVADIIREHTILPYYLPFANARLAATAMSAMAGPSIGSLKFQLGLLTSRFRANHPLKACPGCVRDDRQQHSIAYWHLDHQFPGVWACPIHECGLIAADVKGTGVGRFLWALPTDGVVQQHGGALDRSAPNLVALARSSIALASMPTAEHFLPNVVRATYRQALHARGLIAKRRSGHLKLQAIGTEYLEFVRPLRVVDELMALPSDADAASAEAGRLLYAYRSGTHPLRHLAFVTWLFQTFGNFVEAYKSTLRDEGEVPAEETHAGQTADATATSRGKSEFLALVAEGLTISGAARRLGVDPSSGMHWAAQAGISTKKRPSLLKGEVKSRMLVALRRGADKEVAARIGGVSISSITRLLRTEVGLREEWRSAQFANAQRVARRRWLRAVSANPASGVKVARAVQPAAYAWLYRNDREWLASQCGVLERVSREGGLKIDWDSRDSSLAADVRRVGLELAMTGHRSKILLWHIYQRLPELKAKLSKLDRLPLTRSAIFGVMQRTPRSTVEGQAETEPG